MKTRYFSDVIPALANKSTSGAMGWLNYSNKPLRKHLYNQFRESFGKGSFIGDPTFEATFGWMEADVQFKDLSDNLLESELIKALSSPVGELEEYCFKPHYHPYEHQLQSWKILENQEKKSLLVTSGTGSGKTECFLIPILNRLVKQANMETAPLVGVRALFLYPLNALIDSQQKRLDAWTQSFNDRIRFCLYNGNTPEQLSEDVKRKRPNEVVDRETLRSSPPPMLVTNPTMLEFMLVRPEDHPILEKSKGCLEWIVLDEAHTYIGSQAAELSLLLRRVLLAFGRETKDVRFIATSATLGSDNGEKLKQFIAKLAGVSQDRVEVVYGKRHIPILPSVELDPSLTWTDLGNSTEDVELYEKAIQFKSALDIRNQFIHNDSTSRRLSDLGQVVYGSNDLSFDQQIKLLEKLDLLTYASSEEGPFLPLRGHLFHRTFNGLWACADPSCPQKRNAQLDSSEWPFGNVYSEVRQQCTCGGPIFEVVACEDCHEVFLMANRDDGHLNQVSKDHYVDDFQLEVEISDDEEEELTSMNRGQAFKCLLTRAGFKNSSVMNLDPVSRKIGIGQFSVHYLDYALDGRGCPNCSSRNSRDADLQFRDGRIGAPYLLNGVLPTLLEYATKVEEPFDKPYYGRRVLTFSDSRQGTARLAAKLQQDTERTFIRSFIYHTLAIQNSTNSEEYNGYSEVVNNPLIPQEVKDWAQHKIVELSAPKMISFNDMVVRVANSGRDFERILNSYSRFNREVFSQNVGPELMARILIFREFGRRPRRANSLETMGMVALEYDGLNRIQGAPADWIERQKSVDDWKDFLKLILDHTLRGNGAIELNDFDKIQRWLGLPYRQHLFLSPNEIPNTRRQKRWPNVTTGRTRNKMVHYLSHLLNLDLNTKSESDIIDRTLVEAFRALRNAGLLRPTQEGGFRVPCETFQFKLVEYAYLCPITHRFLDTTVSGYSPYKAQGHLTNVCRMVKLPIYRNGYDESDQDTRIKNARIWLEQEEQKEMLQMLRRDGYWTVYNDRVIENSPYFVTAEHSAQVSAKDLRNYASKFRDGDINLLSCSTTMEMGIDIGGVSVVGMNNVPPHPANYLQRAGRAGRRKEPRSLVFTLCKSNPHDLYVFHNSEWAFKTQLPVPQVDLHSSPIVQRHVNSLTLSHFLLRVLYDGETPIMKLSCGNFFEGEPSLYEQYSEWISDDSAFGKLELQPQYAQLIKGSRLEAERVTMQDAIKEGLSGLEQIKSDYIIELRSISELLVEAGNRDSPQKRAIGNRLRRLQGEYLLKELSLGGYLPGYGFPTHIAPLDNLTLEDVSNRKYEREDNQYTRRELPSRDTVSALREYAPGSHVVINGRVYKSSGITLNWHQPASETEARELQSIRFAWRCKHCGASGTTSDLTTARTCSTCKEAIDANNIVQYVEPAGFTVDYFQPPDNDLSKQEYIPVEPVWVNGKGKWQELDNKLIGRFRVTSEGQLFHHSKGLNGNGYALCLSCGRAEAMTHEGEVPKILAGNHDRVRRTKKSIRCKGSENEWAIKQKIAFGVSIETDILELNLKTRDGNWLRDSIVANTLAVAFRQSISSLLGIQAQELDCASFERVYDGDDYLQSIVIFDRFNAGYSTASQAFVDQLYERTLGVLDCRGNCDSACPKCILDFDQRSMLTKLDRMKAIEYLKSLMGFNLGNKVSYFQP